MSSSPLSALGASAGLTPTCPYLSDTPRSPKLNTGPQAWSHECQIQEKAHCPGCAGYTFAETAQSAAGLLCHKGTRLTHLQPLATRQPLPSQLCLTYNLCLQHGPSYSKKLKGASPQRDWLLSTLAFGEKSCFVVSSLHGCFWWERQHKFLLHGICKARKVFQLCLAPYPSIYHFSSSLTGLILHLTTKV